ncbi:MAG: hypothetical protein O9275_07030 [Microcystis sp. LE19-196.1B]|nr:hypothetical protein [Microcystis sp. LE19-196.1B]
MVLSLFCVKSNCTIEQIDAPNQKSKQVQKKAHKIKNSFRIFLKSRLRYQETQPHALSVLKLCVNARYPSIFLLFVAVNDKTPLEEIPRKQCVYDQNKFSSPDNCFRNKRNKRAPQQAFKVFFFFFFFFTLCLLLAKSIKELHTI